MNHLNLMKMSLCLHLFSRDEWNEAVKTLNHWLAHLEIVNSLEALEFCRSSKQQGQRLFR